MLTCKCRNVGMPEKRLVRIGIFAVSQLCQSGIGIPASGSAKFVKVKGIFQPFELGGVTRLIRSAVKFYKAGNL